MYARRKLETRGLEILTRAKVIEVSPRGVRLGDGRFIPTRLVVWTAGTSPHPLVAHLPCRCERGRIAVDATLAVPGWPRVWAVGDCAAIPDAHSGGYAPPTAQHAIREAATVAANVVASLDGRPRRPFTFRTLGQLAAIGRRTGVARVFGFKFSGFFAWWLWRTVYLGKLPRFDKKVRVAIDWTLDLVFAKDFVQFLTERAATISSPEGAAETTVPALPVTLGEGR